MDSLPPKSSFTMTLKTTTTLTPWCCEKKSSQSTLLVIFGGRGWGILGAFQFMHNLFRSNCIQRRSKLSELFLLLFLFISTHPARSAPSFYQGPRMKAARCCRGDGCSLFPCRQWSKRPGREPTPEWGNYQTPSKQKAERKESAN